MDIPSSISTGSIQQYIETGKILVQNWTSDTINNDDVAQQYQLILWELGKFYTLGAMEGVGVDFSTSLGDFKINKGQKSSANVQRMDFINQNIKLNLNTLGRSAPFYQTE